MIEAFDCPKCGRHLERSGAVECDGVTCSVFQCDECMAYIEMFGKPVSVALTFAVDEQGHPFDPASPDGRLPV